LWDQSQHRADEPKNRPQTASHGQPPATDAEPQYARRVRYFIPRGELQSTAQVARATAILGSDAANSMTGSVLLVDRGCSPFQFPEDNE
jgi:hypothetical protein